MALPVQKSDWGMLYVHLTNEMVQQDYALEMYLTIIRTYVKIFLLHEHKVGTCQQVSE